MKLLTLNEIAALIEKVDAKRDEELDKLQDISDPAMRALKANLGIFGRLGAALVWLEQMNVNVVIDRDLPAIKLSGSVSVTLFDAYIDVPK